MEFPGTLVGAVFAALAFVSPGVAAPTPGIAPLNSGDRARAESLASHDSGVASLLEPRAFSIVDAVPWYTHARQRIGAGVGFSAVTRISPPWARRPAPAIFAPAE